MKASPAYTRFVSNVLLPPHERLKHPDTVAVRRQMEETQWRPAQRLQALQVEHLQALLVDAHQLRARDYSAPLRKPLMFEAFFRPVVHGNDVEQAVVTP